MTKQEEIREGIASILESQCWVSASLEVSDKILSYLHSQGVVRKVVTELPVNPYSATSIPEEDVGKWLGYHKALEDMAGYVAVEPLIEEKVP